MRKLLAGLLSIAMMCVLAGCGSSASETGSTSKATNKSGDVITLTIAHGSSETHPLHRALQKFAEQLNATGHFKVQLYPNQQFGSDEEMIQSVKTGDLSMCVSPTSYFANDLPSLSMVEMPYVFPNVATARATLEGDWGKQQISQLEKTAGLHALGFMESGMRELTNNKKQIFIPSDLKGLKLRTMNVEVHTTFWNSLGCSAEGSAFSELYTNLSTGVYDGEENPIAQIYNNKFYEVQKYITMTDHVYTTYLPVMKTSFWNNLSAEDRESIQKAFKNCQKAELTMLEEDQKAQLKKITDFGCEVTNLTNEQKQRWIDAAQPTLEKYAATIGKDAYKQFVEAVKASTVK